MSAKGSTGWYREMDTKLKLVTRELRAFNFMKKHVDDWRDTYDPTGFELMLSSGRVYKGEGVIYQIRKTE